MSINSEAAAVYLVGSNPTLTKPRTKPTVKEEDAVIAQALKILSNRMRKKGPSMESPTTASDYLHLQLSGKEHEVFACLFLDNRHRLIEYRELFNGTIDGASVHPREVVKAVLAVNAAAVIFAHNHPSGITDPSPADLRITQRLKDALALIEVRVLDHLIVGGDKDYPTYSMAEHSVL